MSLNKEVVKKAVEIVEHLCGTVESVKLFNDGAVAGIVSRRTESGLYVQGDQILTWPPRPLGSCYLRIRDCSQADCHAGCGCGCMIDHNMKEVDDPQDGGHCRR